MRFGNRITWKAPVIGLCIGTNLQTRHLLTSDISFVFENGTWIGGHWPRGNASGLPDTFARNATQFLNAPWNPTAMQGATQRPVLSAISSFMLNYTLWANECPHFDYHGNGPTNNPGTCPNTKCSMRLGAGTAMWTCSPGPTVC